MKFELGDATDKALVATLAHEMALCKERFSDFLQFAHESHKQPSCKVFRIKAHEAYSQFISHLYEFYVGCISRDRQNTSKLTYDELDKVLTSEAQKQLAQRRLMIKEGVLPGGERLLATFMTEAPSEFGSHFRLVRNRTAHALTERSNPCKAPDLNSFFKNYHQLILILFFTGQFAWDIKNVDDFDWGDIEDFNFGA